MKRKPIIAVVGRPNTGKSTFVNRLIGNRKSIVDDSPGVTRDRIYFDVEWLGRQFTVIDTGGIIPADDDKMMQSIINQAEIACLEADKIVFMVDGKDGVNPIDYDIANILRRSDKPVFLAVNKVDSYSNSSFMLSDFYSLAIGEPIAVSALHGSGGVGDLLDMITEDFKVNPEDGNEEKIIKIAIAGKPNAGKSSIVNAILGKNRVIVSDIAGTTRDSIDSEIIYNNQKYIIADTAGLRKKSKVDYGIEKFAADRAIRAIKGSDITVLVIDAVSGISDQDKKIASIITESGKGMIIAVNKWDLIENKSPNTLKQFEKDLVEKIPFLNYVPKIFISAVTHQRLNQIFTKVNDVYVEYTKRISTGLLNKIINDAYCMNPPQSVKNKRLKILYSTQAGVQPPEIVIFTNNGSLLKENYRRYLENKLRESFGFEGTPVKIAIRERSDKNR